MALFKILKGLLARLPNASKLGYAYYTTDKGKFYIFNSKTLRRTLNPDIKITIGNQTKTSTTLSPEVAFDLASIGAAAAGHNHDNRYLKLSGGTMTGDIIFTNKDANRLIWTDEDKKVSTTGHYATSDRVAINSASYPGYNLLVNGTTLFQGETVTRIVRPEETKKYSLGTDDYKWSALYVSGNAQIDGSIKNLAVNGGIYWNPYVESTGDASDVASIEVIKAGVAGGTELRIKQMNDANDVVNIVTNSTKQGFLHNGNVILNASNYTDYTVKKDGAGASGNWNINAATATELQTARNINLGNDLQGGVSFNGTSDVTINASSYHCNVDSGNTSNYPWHRIARVDNMSGQWIDRVAILDLHRKYNSGGYGRIKVSLRTNSTNSAVNISAVWLYRYGFAVDLIAIVLNGNTGSQVWADIYLKCGAYARTTVYQVEGDRLWTLVSSSERLNTTTTDKKGSTEVYTAPGGARAGSKTVYGVDGAITLYSMLPYGFTTCSTNSTWGNTIGTTITTWNDSTSGSIDFRRDNPSGGKMSVKVNGRFYGNEGINPASLMTNANGYWGMGDPDGNVSNWIRTTANGLIPSQGGNQGSGHSALGTSSWYFKEAFIDTVNGTNLYLRGQTGNRLVWLNSSKMLDTTGHYASGSKIAVNSTGEPGYNFYVNGTSYFTGTIRAKTAGSSWIDGLKGTDRSALLVTDATDSDSYWPWISHHNISSKRYFSLGQLANSIYLIGTTDTRTTNGYDYGWQFDFSNGVMTVPGNIQPVSTNTQTLGTSSLRWAKVYIGTADTYGSTTKGVYWNAGVPTAMTYELKSTVNNGIATSIAYYSGTNAVSSGSIVTDGSYLRNIGGYNNSSYSLSAESAIINNYLNIAGISSSPTRYKLYVVGLSWIKGTLWTLHLYPKANQSYNLGSNDYKWNGIHANQLWLYNLLEGNSDVTNNTEILTSYASDNGFADSNANGKIYRRDAIHLYNYIIGKADGRYAWQCKTLSLSGRVGYSGFYQSSSEADPAKNRPVKGWMHLINAQHSNTANNFALQIAGGFLDNKDFYIRLTNNSDATIWNRILTNNNYTSYVTTLRDRTNGTATYSNYGASNLAGSAISCMTCWNGYELRAISKAEVYNLVRDNGGNNQWVKKAGDTMTGNLSFASIGDTATSAKISWSGSTDGADIYYQTTGADQSNLVLNTRDDANCYIRFAYNGAFKSYIRTSDGTYIGKLLGISEGSTWINGQRYERGGFNLSNATTTTDYWPWLRQTNTSSARWFSFGTLGNCFYMIGSSTGRTDNGYDHGLCYDISNGNLSGINDIYGNAQHLLINGVTWSSNWNWSGQEGQPSWLWGSNDGSNMYVWNPSNFSVYRAKELYNTDRGTNQIYCGPNDAADGAGGRLNNLVISSWQGVSFTTSCAATYQNKTAVGIDCRNGHISAGGSLWISQNGDTGGGIHLGDDGGFYDFNNGFGTAAFSSGLIVARGKDQNNTAINLSSAGRGWAYSSSEAQFGVKCDSAGDFYLYANGTNRGIYSTNLGSVIILHNDNIVHMYANTYHNLSDIRLKQNIFNLKLKLSVNFIRLLLPVKFQFKHTDKYCFGFIAQDVLKVMKNFNLKEKDYNLVTKPEFDPNHPENERYYNISYTELIAPTIKAVQYLDKLIEQNKQKEKELQQLILKLKSLIQLLNAKIDTLVVSHL